MTQTSESHVTLKTNLADYAVTAALKEGRVTSDLVKFDFCGPKTAHDGFKPMIRDNAFDAGELALVTYLQAKDYGKPYVLLPIPVVGSFKHQSIGFNEEFGFLSPKDIEGRKVGVRTYAQTTGMWVRGILQHEYGVDLNKVTWCTIDGSHLAEYSDPSNCQRLPEDAKLGQMMLAGELAAAIMGKEMPKDPRVKRLIPDPQAAAEQWYAREQVIPINHLFVIHEQLARERPDVVREVFRMLKESRELAPEGATKRFPPVGLEANRKALEFAIKWSFEQKIISRQFSVDELFDEVCASLS